jgi:lipopolysaccharide heptosyltransferase II
MDARRIAMLTRPGAVKRILVRGTNWIGDAVLTTPALMAIRKGFPKAKNVLLVKPAIAELLHHHPAVDEIVLYRDPGPHAGLGGKLTLARLLRHGRYDLAILLQNAFEAAAITALAGIPNRYGYATDGRSLLLTHRVPLIPKIRRRHQLHYYLELLRPLGIPVEPEPPMLRTTPGEDAEAIEHLRACGVDPKKVLIGLNPGSIYGTAKRWLPERFAAVADRVAAEHGGVVLIFGGRGEEELGAAIAGMMTAPTLVLSGRTTMRRLMALIKPCRLFITNDTGPMHIATAFGVPTVAIFGPTDPATTSPVGSRHELVRHPVDCSPCLLRECPIDHRCMQGISVEMVHTAAMRQLRTIGVSPPPSPSPLKGEGNIKTSPGAPIALPTAMGHGKGRVRGRNEAAPVVYLDRDGTLNFDPGYLNQPEQLRLLPGVGPAVARLNRAGFRTVVLSNQSGVARGLITQDQLEGIHKRLRELLAEHGAWLDGIFICPHHPDEGCNCRKPAPGLIHRAHLELGATLDNAIVIGDKATDMDLARNVGALAIFVRSGNAPQEEQARMAARGLEPDYVARDLTDAVRWILAEVAVRSTLNV